MLPRLQGARFFAAVLPSSNTASLRRPFQGDLETIRNTSYLTSSLRNICMRFQVRSAVWLARFPIHNVSNCAALILENRLHVSDNSEMMKARPNTSSPFHVALGIVVQTCAAEIGFQRRIFVVGASEASKNSTNSQLKSERLLKSNAFRVPRHVLAPIKI